MAWAIASAVGIVKMDAEIKTHILFAIISIYLYFGQLYNYTPTSVRMQKTFGEMKSKHSAKHRMTAKEYKTSKSWAIFIYLTCPAIIVGFIMFWANTAQVRGFYSVGNLLGALISVPMILLSAFAMIETYRSRFIVQEDGLKTISTFKIKVLPFEEIKGYREKEHEIVIEAKRGKHKNISISKYFAGYYHVRYELMCKFPDLNAEDLMKEKKSQAEEEILNLSPEQLKSAKDTAKIINWSAGIFVACMFLLPSTYQYTVLITMAIPIVGLLLIKISNHAISANLWPYPSIMGGLAIASFGLAFRTSTGYRILDYSNLWLLSLFAGMGFLCLFWLVQDGNILKRKANYINDVFLACILYFYCFGALLHVNCWFSRNRAQHLTPVVLTKKTSSGKGSTLSYYIELSGWGNHPEIYKLQVNQQQYNEAIVGKGFSIYFHEGILGIPWVMI